MKKNNKATNYIRFTMPSHEVCLTEEEMYQLLSENIILHQIGITRAEKLKFVDENY